MQISKHLIDRLSRTPYSVPEILQKVSNTDPMSGRELTKNKILARDGYFYIKLDANACAVCSRNKIITLLYLSSPELAYVRSNLNKYY